MKGETVSPSQVTRHFRVRVSVTARLVNVGIGITALEEPKV